MPISPNGYNTLKQRKFKKAIKEGAKTLKQAADKAGYSESSGTVYQNRRKSIALVNEALGITDEEVINDFRLGKKLSLKQKDLTNFSRNNENLARIKGLYAPEKHDLTFNNRDAEIVKQFKGLPSGT